MEKVVYKNYVDPANELALKATEFKAVREFNINIKVRLSYYM